MTSSFSKKIKSFENFNNENTPENEFHINRYNKLKSEFDNLKLEYQNYRADMKEAQLLMGEKLHTLYNKNFLLQEENISLVKEFSQSGKKWFQKFFY